MIFFYCSLLDEKRIERKVIRNICSSMQSAGRQDVIFVDARFRFFDVFRVFLRSKRVIVHSPLIFSFIHVFFGRLMLKKVIGIVWDVYPVLIDGHRFDSSIKRRVLDFFERMAFSLCHEIIYPSKDFFQSAGVSNASLIRVWPQISYVESVADCNASDLLRVVYAGQINETRDIEGAFLALKKKLKGGFVLLVASSDPLPLCMRDDLSVKYLGFLDNNALGDVIRGAHFGLVSLNKLFCQPGFPSKIFDYLSSGVPVIYRGPELPDYFGMIEACGLGVDISSCSSLGVSDYMEMKINFDKKVMLFSSRACFSDVELVKLMKII